MVDVTSKKTFAINHSPISTASSGVTREALCEFHELVSCVDIVNRLLTVLLSP